MSGSTGDPFAGGHSTPDAVTLDTPQREMSLAEYIAVLPSSHRASRQYSQMLGDLAALSRREGEIIDRKQTRLTANAATDSLAIAFPPHPSHVQGEAVAWGLVNAESGKILITDTDRDELQEYADSKREGLPRDTVVPLYASPAPSVVDREKVENAIDSLMNATHADGLLGGDFKSDSMRQARSELLALIFPTTDRTGGTDA